jgi:nitrite reductase (NADH) large subunit
MQAQAQSLPIFPNYMQMKQPLPIPLWQRLRVLSVLCALSVIALLAVYPRLGLFLFWGLLVPVLPLVFFLAPGLWRNLCPMAALNQTPRVFGFTRGRVLPQWLKEYGYVLGIVLFLVIVPSRKVIFNDNGPALALLLLAAFSTAFVMGTIFKGKSGWCSSMCPLLPVQRLYGQTPFVTIPNSHCQPCVGCTKNCYDFNPGVAYFADLYDSDPYYARYRKFFAGAFPGLVLAFYEVPTPPAISNLEMYARFALYIGLSLASFMLLESFVKVTAPKITALYAAAAFNIYYWYNVPLFIERIGEPWGWDAPYYVVYPIRAAVFLLTAFWVARTVLRERQFVAQSTAAGPVQVGSTRALQRHRAAQAGQPAVLFVPEDKQVVVEPGRTLLEIAESNGLKIEAGCRMGMCGADPVAIVEGLENLSSVGDDEQTTLNRLGLAENTRMACCARVQGRVCVSLTPEKRRPGEGGARPAAYDPSVERVVIIGNGIAGVTAADYLRRNHPACEIHVVGREQHHLYNRMAITRLLYERSAMPSLMLLAPDWYEEHTITTWLNTRATRIVPESREVLLGTGETLTYDRLILAMGSRSFVPPIAGFPMPGTFVLREAEDAMQIRAFRQTYDCHDAVVGGGGLLGLEAAYALHKMHLDVTVLERGEYLLRRQLDQRAADFLREYLEGLGINIVLGAETASVQGEGRLMQVTLKDGRRLRADMFLVCVGITPNIALAANAGFDYNKGVIVDERMRVLRGGTPADGVYAAGDVAEYDGQIYGLWPAAVEQAEVAAVNAVGGDRVFKGITPVTILKVAGIDLTSIGRFEAESPEDVVVVHEDIAEHRYRKLVIAGGRAVGAILLGHPLDAPAVQAVIKKGLDVQPVLDTLRAGDWSVLAKLS